MNEFKIRITFAVLVFAVVLGVSSAYGQLTPIGDSYTNTADPTTNYGAKTLLDVESATQTTYIQFNLSSIPSGYTSADITQATLKLYVNTVTKAGSFNVYTSTAPGRRARSHPASPRHWDRDRRQRAAHHGGQEPVHPDQRHRGSAGVVERNHANDGIALVGNSPLNASFDSKESTTTSHPAGVDIVFAGGGTITGVTTASGSGLTGGGTSGTLNLSLTNACAANQVLQWNGNSWVCAAVGTGTITGVTAGTDLSGGGTSGNVTLSLNTTATNALYAQLAAANTFTGNQTVNGNLSATGVVTGSGFQIGSNLFAFGSFKNTNVFLGFAGNSTMTGTDNTATGQLALATNTTGNGNVATGGAALYLNTTGFDNTASGLEALLNNTTGNDNTASGAAALYFNTTGGSNTAFGDQALSNNTTGGGNTASGYSAGYTADASRVTGNNNTAVGIDAFFGTGSLSNATAIGANSEVTASNAMVLGGIAGVNNGTDTFVGIGTTAPTNLLTLVGDITNVADTVLSASSASPDGTWIGLTNTYDSGGKTWNIISAGPGDGEGDGNLVFTRLGGGTVQVDGNLIVTGNLSKGGGSFKIDHPARSGQQVSLPLLRRIARHDERLQRQRHDQRRRPGRQWSCPIISRR